MGIVTTTLPTMEQVLPLSTKLLDLEWLANSRIMVK